MGLTLDQRLSELKVYEHEDEITCPYCHKAETDSWECSANSSNEWVEHECGWCGEEFLMRRVTFDCVYDSKPKDQQLSAEGEK